MVFAVWCWPTVMSIFVGKVLCDSDSKRNGGREEKKEGGRKEAYRMIQTVSIYKHIQSYSVFAKRYRNQHRSAPSLLDLSQTLAADSPAPHSHWEVCPALCSHLLCKIHFSLTCVGTHYHTRKDQMLQTLRGRKYGRCSPLPPTLLSK